MGEAWIIDGNYGNTLTMRLERCELVIYFDMRGCRAVRRSEKNCYERGKTRADLGDGCPERLDWEFLKYTGALKKTRRYGISSS